MRAHVRVCICLCAARMLHQFDTECYPLHHKYILYFQTSPLWMRVFLFVPVDELMSSVIYVCKAWERFLKSSEFWTKVRFVRLTKPTTLGDFSRILPRMSELSSLSIDLDLLSNLECFLHLKKVKQLKLYGGQNYTSGIIAQYLKGTVKSLEHFSSSITFKKEELLLLVYCMPNILVLNTPFSQITPDDFGYICSKTRALRDVSVCIDSNDIEEWANILNEWFGRVFFHINIVDQVPGRLLHHNRAQYYSSVF